jgi:sulfur-oxidizing protein SoxY
MTSLSRRDTLLSASLLGALTAIGLLSPALARAAGASPFTATSMDEALKALGATPTASTDITLTSPDIAENGAVVQVGVQSRLPRTEEIHLLVEKNANPLAASFTLPAGTSGFVQTRLKMGQTTAVWALVKADGRWYSATRESKVTLGGCGG